METQKQDRGLSEYWGLRALEYCSDELWPSAEKGDERWWPKYTAISIMRRNPNKYKHVGIWKHEGGKEWKNLNLEGR